MKHTTTVVNTVLVILVTLTVNLVIYLSFYRERRVVDIQLNAAIPLATGSPTVQIDKTQADKVLREIIVDQVQSEANKVISLVNFPITIFSILMTLLALLFGSVTVRTITEARDLLARIEKEPETLLQTYFRNQLPLLFQKVFDPNPIMRVETIKQLAQNTEINQTHFDMLRSVVEKEVSEGAGIFTYSNLALLIPLLYKLDPKRTSDLLFGFLEQSHGLQATSLLVSFTVSTSENANDPRIRRLLLNASPQEGTTIVSQLLFAAKPNSDLIGFIGLTP